MVVSSGERQCLGATGQGVGDRGGEVCLATEDLGSHEPGSPPTQWPQPLNCPLGTVLGHAMFPLNNNQSLSFKTHTK